MHEGLVHRSLSRIQVLFLGSCTINEIKDAALCFENGIRYVPLPMQDAVKREKQNEQLDGEKQ